MRVLCCETCGLVALRRASLMACAGEAIAHLERFGCSVDRLFIHEVTR